MSLLWLVGILLLRGMHSNFDCTVSTTSLSGTSDDAQRTIKCADANNGEYPTMVSCGFRSRYVGDEEVDGAWMSTDGESCTAQNGQGGSGVYAVARYLDLAIPN